LAAPTNLIATPGDAEIVLNWQTVANANYYHILRALSNDGPFTLLAPVISTNFTDSGLTNGTKYFYSVQAFNSVGSSGNSVAVSARPVSTAPPHLALSPSGGTILLAWPASHLGWRLQVQTNSLALGLSTNWIDVPGATATNFISMPALPNSGSGFYRLVYP
jgi:cellulose 1,4-beta-cellobiosidase